VIRAFVEQGFHVHPVPVSAFSKDDTHLDPPGVHLLGAVLEDEQWSNREGRVVVMIGPPSATR
jgi:hypothetical protein